MKLLSRKIILIGGIFFIYTISVKADLTSNQFNYPKKLFISGHYYRSISEIRKLEFYFPQESERYQLHLLLLKNYYHLSDVKKVDQTAREIFSLNPEQPHTSLKKDSAKILTFSLLKRGEEVKARQVWEQLVMKKEDLSFPMSGQREDQADPEKAKLYSYILPGSGLIMTGSYGKASVSFLLNALFLAGISNSLENKQTGIASLLFFFEWSWYFGGARAAEEAAINYNQNRIQEARNEWISEQSFQLFN
ncbi:MAG: hypothetical protein GY786_11905 [Proteobacteria bacterium]|nr:hypothetical protein [Pseudomonadota bacterium]